MQFRDQAEKQNIKQDWLTKNQVSDLKSNSVINSNQLFSGILKCDVNTQLFEQKQQETSQQNCHWETVCSYSNFSQNNDLKNIVLKRRRSSKSRKSKKSKKSRKSRTCRQVQKCRTSWRNSNIENHNCVNPRIESNGNNIILEWEAIKADLKQNSGVVQISDTYRQTQYRQMKSNLIQTGIGKLKSLSNGKNNLDKISVGGLQTQFLMDNQQTFDQLKQAYYKDYKANNSLADLMLNYTQYSLGVFGFLCIIYQFNFCKINNANDSNETELQILSHESDNSLSNHSQKKKKSGSSNDEKKKIHKKKSNDSSNSSLKSNKSHKNKKKNESSSSSNSSLKQKKDQKKKKNSSS